jgi:signal transduction histidine kinase
VQETIDGALRFVSERAENLSIDMACQVSPPDVALIVDERKLKQILVNLLDNAVKFTKSGGRVSLTGEVDATGAYVLIVEDTGIGIEAADIPLVLERFGQTTGSREQGTGLGLPLSRALAELHGGSLTLTSDVGVGTRVTVTLPARRVLPPRRSRSADGAG